MKVTTKIVSILHCSLLSYTMLSTGKIYKHVICLDYEHLVLKDKRSLLCGF